MAAVQAGDTVKVHYTGKLEDGTVFDTSAEREPLEFTLGSTGIIPGFEQAIMGMNPGESKTITIPSADAYGPHDEKMVFQVQREQLDPSVKPEVGQQLQVHRDDGEAFVVKVVEIGDDGVTLDANHPLAGLDLTFDIELLEIA